MSLEKKVCENDEKYQVANKVKLFHYFEIFLCLPKSVNMLNENWHLGLRLQQIHLKKIRTKIISEQL
jgi:hypothetical protein